MTDNDFWIALWRIIAAVIAVFILSVSGCTVIQSHIVAGMVEAGVDPIKAACSMSGSTKSEIVCSTAAQK